MSDEKNKVILPLSQRPFYYNDEKRGVSRKAIQDLLPYVNERRPFCSADCEKRHFIENIATTPAQAAFWRAYGEFCIKAYGD